MSPVTTQLTVITKLSFESFMAFCAVYIFLVISGVVTG